MIGVIGVTCVISMISVIRMTSMIHVLPLMPVMPSVRQRFHATNSECQYQSKHQRDRQANTVMAMELNFRQQIRGSNAKERAR
jgi:hypothetical protein